MNDHSPIEDLKVEASRRGKDPKTRTLLIFLLVLWLVTFVALLGVAWRAYFKEKDESQTLAQQIHLACNSGIFGSDFSFEDREALCNNAEKVIRNDPELQDEEIQEAENQEPEIQEREVQDPELADAERQDAEEQEAEFQDEELQESEINDPETQEAEIQDEEVQDPEVDDPDPASPYTFTFTFTVPGNGNQPGTTYTVTCNSGTGACTVS